MPTPSVRSRLSEAALLVLAGTSFGLGVLAIRPAPAAGPDQAARPEASSALAPPLTTREPHGAIALTGVVRDFRRFDAPGGHPDFQSSASGLRRGLVAPRLAGEPGQPGWPVLASLRGLDPETGRAGATNAIASPASFATWFRDSAQSPARAHTIHLTPGPDGNHQFAAVDIPETRTREGFFPLDGHMLDEDGFHAAGVFASPSSDGIAPAFTRHNWWFTYELDAAFTYQRGTGQFLTAGASDDLWVFVNGSLAIDHGGAHALVEDRIELDRLGDTLGLPDGAQCRMRLFMANRRSGRCEFRLATNLDLRPALGTASASRAR